MNKAEIEKIRDEGALAAWTAKDYCDGFNAAVEILWPRLVGLSKSIDSYKPGYDWCPKLAQALKEHGVSDAEEN